jgi:hypothetical protein
MAFAGFAVTKGAAAPRALAGSLVASDSARANRRNRRHARQAIVRARGVDVVIVPKLSTDWQVV